jgi:hypothetical protein
MVTAPPAGHLNERSTIIGAQLRGAGADIGNFLRLVTHKE